MYISVMDIAEVILQKQGGEQPQQMESLDKAAQERLLDTAEAVLDRVYDALEQAIETGGIGFGRLAILTQDAVQHLGDDVRVSRNILEDRHEFLPAYYLERSEALLRAVSENPAKPVVLPESAPDVFAEISVTPEDVMARAPRLSRERAEGILTRQQALLRQLLAERTREAILEIIEVDQDDAAEDASHV